jgi:hypothetical protein
VKPADVRAYAKVARELGVSELYVASPEGVTVRLVLSPDVAAVPAPAVSRPRGKKNDERPKPPEPEVDPDRLEVPDADAEFARWKAGQR